MPANFSLAIRSDVPPVAPYPAPRLVQADLASAYSVGKASLDLILVAGLVPRLQLEISRIGRCAAEREWDTVVKLEVDEEGFVQFQLVNEPDLDARRVARRRPHGLCPAGDAHRLADRLLHHRGIKRQVSGLAAGTSKTSGSASKGTRISLDCRIGKAPLQKETGQAPASRSEP